MSEAEEDLCCGAFCGICGRDIDLGEFLPMDEADARLEQAGWLLKKCWRCPKCARSSNVRVFLKTRGMLLAIGSFIIAVGAIGVVWPRGAIGYGTIGLIYVGLVVLVRRFALMLDPDDPKLDPHTAPRFHILLAMSIMWPLIVGISIKNFIAGWREARR